MPGRGEEESRKLNDQLTGFVETKLAGGHQRHRAESRKGGNDEQEGVHKQAINTESPQGERENVTRVLIFFPTCSSYLMVAANSVYMHICNIMSIPTYYHVLSYMGSSCTPLQHAVSLTCRIK